MEKKLDSRTASGYFVGYLKRTKGYRFYCPQNTTRFVETQRAVLIKSKNEATEQENFNFDEVIIENGDTMNSNANNKIQVLPSFDLSSTQSVQEYEIVGDPMILDQETQEQQVLPLEKTNENQPAEQNHEQMDKELGRSQRLRKRALPDDYYVYLQESEHDVNAIEDPMNYMQAMSNEKKKDGVWELVNLPQNCKPIACKWVFKTKRNPKGQIDGYKARLVAKGSTRQERIDYNEIYSPISTKDSFRVIMALVAHFDLHLHRIDVKTAFLNGNLQEGIYMKQPEGFIQEKGENLVCKLCKSIDGLKQVLDSENSLDECNYMKKSGRNFIILVLNREKWVLGLSQKNYIEKVLQRFNMQGCGGTDMPISKVDNLSKD
ncbi:unnamed protein product [Prunus armeniaca]